MVKKNISSLFQYFFHPLKLCLYLLFPDSYRQEIQKDVKVRAIAELRTSGTLDNICSCRSYNKNLKKS
jgi:hypothetical protein